MNKLERKKKKRERELTQMLIKRRKNNLHKSSSLIRNTNTHTHTQRKKIECVILGKKFIELKTNEIKLSYIIIEIYIRIIIPIERVVAFISKRENKNYIHHVCFEIRIFFSYSSFRFHSFIYHNDDHC